MAKNPKPVAYEVREPVHAELVDSFAERFAVDLKPGVSRPKSEREEIALEYLVSIGLATRHEEE